MRLLLDTHAFVWAKADPGRLREAARDAIEDPSNEVYVSLASAWELCVKATIGKLHGDVSLLVGSEKGFLGQLETSGLALLNIAPAHVFETSRLPLHHRDPFDRLLVAQALVEGLVLVTNDDSLAAYDVPIVRA